MEISWNFAIITMGAALVTFLPRVLPLMLLSRAKLPEWGERWLSYVPAAVMAALIGQALFVHDGEVRPLSNVAPLISVIPSILVAVWTRSLLFTVLAGIVSVMLIRFM